MEIKLPARQVMKKQVSVYLEQEVIDEYQSLTEAKGLKLGEAGPGCTGRRLAGAEEAAGYPLRVSPTVELARKLLDVLCAE